MSQAHSTDNRKSLKRKFFYILLCILRFLAFSWVGKAANKSDFHKNFGAINQWMYNTLLRNSFFSKYTYLFYCHVPVRCIWGLYRLSIKSNWVFRLKRSVAWSLIYVWFKVIALKGQIFQFESQDSFLSCIFLPF